MTENFVFWRVKNQTCKYLIDFIDDKKKSQDQAKWHKQSSNEIFVMALCLEVNHLLWIWIHNDT